MKFVKNLLVLLILAQPILLNVWQVKAQAQTSVELENVVALVSFGEQITFVATVKSPLPIQEASILILDESQGTTRVEPLTVQSDGRTEFQYDARQNNLRPFGSMSWSYRFILPDGSTTNSEVYSARYEDNRFNWQSLEAGMIRVHWYGDGEDFGQALLDAAQAGLESVSRLIPVSLAQPVDFYIYASLSDLRGTLVPGSQDWIAGHANSSQGIAMVAIEPGPAQESTMQQRIPHELMHILLYRALGNGYANIPAWLSEGMAGLAEMIPNTSYDSALKSAVLRSDWIPMSTLCSSFPADTDRAFLAYAESRSFAGYIDETYGSSGLFKLATAYANGAGCEDGPEIAFGIPLANLEQNWQSSVAGQENLASRVTKHHTVSGVVMFNAACSNHWYGRCDAEKGVVMNQKPGSGNETVRAHVWVKGRVQGVGFRAHVEYSARQIGGLTGWVRNVGYDTVEAVVEGNKDQVEQLIEAIQQGPRASRVDESKVEWETPTDEFLQFGVKRSL